MNSSESLFEKIKRFKYPTDSGTSPQQQLLEYCKLVFGAVERLHVDYKQKDDSKIPSLAESDKKNLAKAVSGFANSGGGILIWGIEDKSLSPFPITDIQKFLSLALELSSQVTDPVVQNVDGEWFPSDLNASDGFGVIHIPESTLPPHRVILSQKEIKNHYYIRSGESFVVASHTQLEDMFGRRPKPQLSFSVKIVPAGGSPGKQDFLIILGIENNGRGIAKSPLLCVKVYKPYSISRYGIDGNMHYGLNPLANSLRSEYERYGASGDIVLHSGIVHDVTAINFEIDWKKSPSEIQDLVIDYQIAAEGVMLIEGQKVIKGQEIWNICQKNP